MVLLSLATGKRITGYQLTVLPITTAVLNRVHDLATAQNQERIEDGGNLTFRWRPDQNAMFFNNDLEEEVDLVNADYVPQDNALLAIEDTQEVIVNDISPDISDGTINIDPINASIEQEKRVQFKEREELIDFEERE